MELLIENALNIGSNEFYRSARYNLPLVVVLVNSKDKKAFDILEKSIRKTDVIQQLDSDTIIMFLSHTKHKEALLFLLKMEEEFDFTYSASEFIDSENRFLKDLFTQNENKVCK